MCLEICYAFLMSFLDVWYDSIIYISCMDVWIIHVPTAAAVCVFAINKELNNPSNIGPVGTHSALLDCWTENEILQFLFVCVCVFTLRSRVCPRSRALRPSPWCTWWRIRMPYSTGQSPAASSTSWPPSWWATSCSTRRWSSPSVSSEPTWGLTLTCQICFLPHKTFTKLFFKIFKILYCWRLCLRAGGLL